MYALTLILIVVYLFPTMVALTREHRQRPAIAVLNIFGGWTVVGWVCALVWACVNPPAPTVVYQAQATPTDPPQPRL